MVLKYLPKLLRTQQWYKNVLLLFFAFFDLSLIDTALRFVGFCFASSITYISNDWQDRALDAKHPKKKHRPLASGAVSGKQALIVVLVLVIVLAAILLSQSLWYAAMIGAYILATVTYTHWGKHIPILDAVFIGANFAFRTLAGVGSDRPVFWIAIAVASMGVFFVTHKRRADQKVLGTAAAIAHKPVLAWYTPKRAYAVRAVAILFFLVSLYFGNITSLPLTILVAIFFFRVNMLLSQNRDAVYSPKVLLKDWFLWLCTVLAGVSLYFL